MAEGTLTVKNQSNKITGAGTTFTSELAAGDFLVFKAVGVAYTLAIKSIESDTELTLIDPYLGDDTEGIAWEPVPARTMAQVTMALVAQVTEAFRRVNRNNENWQALLSSADTVTVKLPDGREITGPGWGSMYSPAKKPTPEEIGALPNSEPVITGTVNATGDYALNGTNSRHIRFQYLRDDGTTATDGYFFKDGPDNPTRRPGVRINCAAPNKETGNEGNSGDWVFGEDGTFSMPGGAGMTGTLNQDPVKAGVYCQTMLSAEPTAGTKHYLRKFRGSQPDTIWHETIAGSVYRLATGRTDELDSLQINGAAWLRAAGELQTNSANGVRLAYSAGDPGTYGFFIRNDGNNTYFLLTNKGDHYGGYNDLRPLWINNAKGIVTLGQGVNVGGAGINTNLLNSTGTITAHNAGPYSWVEQYNSVASAYFEEVNNQNATISEYHSLIKQRVSSPGNSWAFSFGTLISKAATDAAARLDFHLHIKGSGDQTLNHTWDTAGNYNCPGQVIPGNYTNFDALYQRKARMVKEADLEAEDLREHRMRCVIEAMPPLQAAVDLDMATDEEREKLTALKKYLVELYRLDAAQDDIEWPTAPEGC